MTMNFDNIAETQIFEGNTIDCIFSKNRQSRKRTHSRLDRDASLILTTVPVFQSTQEDDSPVISQEDKSDSGQFAFTNENIIRGEQTASVLFKQYFPPEVLKFTDDELADINELYKSLVDQQTQADRMVLSEANVNELEKSSLIEKFLLEQRHVSSLGSNSQSPSFLFDSNSPGINMSSE